MDGRNGGDRHGTTRKAPALFHRAVVGAGIRAAILDLGWLALLGLAFAAGLHASGVRSWPFELIHHFLRIFTLVAAGLIVVGLTCRARYLAATATVALLFFVAAQAIPLPTGRLSPSAQFQAANAPRPIGSPRPAGDREGGKPLSLITNNVFCQNWNSDGLARWLATRPADVVALQEVPAYVDRALAPLTSVYPYQVRLLSDQHSPRRALRTCQGIVLLSIHPISEVTFYQPVADAWPALIARLAIKDTPSVWIAAIHAADPIREAGLPLRDQFLARLGEKLNSLHGPLIVAGDFNASPYTPMYRHFHAAATLSSALWSPATYPSQIGPFGISIDHVLAREATITRLTPLPAVGSDHRPLRAELFLPLVGGDPSLAEHRKAPSSIDTGPSRS